MSKKLKAVAGIALFVAMPLIYRLSFLAWSWAGGEPEFMAWVFTVVAAVASVGFIFDAGGGFEPVPRSPDA